MTNQMEHCRILIIDDNKDLQLMLTYILKQEGFTDLKSVGTCQEALLALADWKPDFIILDVMLPDGDGFSLMEVIRQQSEIPVLFLSAKDEDKDRLMGLGLGADDYLTKPFLPKELLLRMKSILRRTYSLSFREPSSQNTLILGRKKIDFAKATVTLLPPSASTLNSVKNKAPDLGKSSGLSSDTSPEKEITLTAKELTLLKKLADNRGNIVTFDALSQALWGDSYYGYENSLMVHIRRLREKIEETPSQPQWLLTARGLGYKLKKS